ACGEPGVGVRVGAGAGDDLLLQEYLHHFFRLLAVDLEAADARGQSCGARRVEVHAPDAGQPVLDPTVELGDACGDAGATDGLVHLVGGDGGPLVLVGLEAAGSHAPGVGRALHRTAVDPGVVGLLFGEGRDERPEPSPGVRARPDEAGTARPVNPLVGPG